MTLSKIAIAVLLSVGILTIVVITILAVNNNRDNFKAPATKPSCPLTNAAPLNALDGFGKPVTWWVVIKLPSSLLTASDYFGDDVLTRGDLKNNWVSNGNDEFGFMRMINTGKKKCSGDNYTYCNTNDDCKKKGGTCQFPSTFTSRMASCKACGPMECAKCAPEGLKNLYKDEVAKPPKKGSPLSVKSRSAGLCYLYADSNNPKFTFFTSMKSPSGETKSYECLGQGGNDPLSQTLRQIYIPAKKKKPPPKWAFWSDQSYQPADSWRGSTSFPESLGTSQNSENAIYPHPHSGCSRPGAHSKGVIAYDDSGGFLLQSSFPMYPDFSFMSDSKPGFVKLGCQLDNNVSFAQAAFCFSFPNSEAPKLQSMFKSALICSNGSPTCTPAAADSQNSGYGITGSLMKCQSDDLGPDWKAAMNYGNYKKGSDTVTVNASVNGVNGANSKGTPVPIQVVAKSQYDTQPPWVIVAQALDSDLSVASWWSPDYGAPSICKDTDYNRATNKFCLKQSLDIVSSDGVEVSQPLWPFGTDGYPRHNIEMILSLKLDPSNVPGIENVFKYTKIKGKNHTQYCKIAGSKDAPVSYDQCVKDGYPVDNPGVGFFTLGGVFDAGNHCKLGLSTPSDGKPNKNLVIMGDMNHEGYPGVVDCSKSQYGRGGLFFAISNADLWKSFRGCVNKVCACTSDSIGSHRFCGQGSYPGLLWWDTGAPTVETPEGGADLASPVTKLSPALKGLGPGSTHQPWYFRQMSTDDCFKHKKDLAGTDATACIGTGYQEFGDYYNAGFEWPQYPAAGASNSTSFWDTQPNAWKWVRK
jgi:hypothetical protein